ncbi:hypothetical protein [Paracraurococcus lichenis]|uniref:Uncharacterized protein n=1 Tax=Paracraurococcus lichenis TaxID=3064888 RepID=A0ABT9E9Q2_9PROT|nr:hypothetical protein [Paracraurococcus sp. LOR1-02]MDO9712931.1 hypothetical protein [Paracraurococcus sp. LOR1-02]
MSVFRLPGNLMQVIGREPKVETLAVGRVGVVDVPGPAAVLALDLLPAHEARLAQHGPDPPVRQQRRQHA